MSTITVTIHIDGKPHSARTIDCPKLSADMARTVATHVSPRIASVMDAAADSMEDMIPTWPLPSM